MTEFDDGKAFVTCKDGGLNFGVLEGPEIEAAELKSGPIRLQVGYPGNSGFGLRHIQGYDDRVKQITGMGYRSISEFCSAVALNYNEVGAARDGRLILCWKTGYYDLQLVIQWHDGYWTIVTGIPSRVARKYEVLCKIGRTSGSEPTPDDAKRPRFATLSLPEKSCSGGNGS